MVVLAASICTRGGKALLSRQFKDLTKDKITSLLSNFPSLISNSNSQHTTVEDENIRYVYQPLEEFYIVLLTNKHSNILQDIDTLHLFASTISNLLRSIDEREIFDNAFEILSSFDEIINNGYKENLTLSQVQTFLSMDSHEEKIQEIIEKNKEMEAIEERKRKAKEIQRKELARKNMESQFSKPYGFEESSYNTSVPSYQTPPAVVDNSLDSSNSSPIPSSKPMMARSGGLQLGKKPSGRTSNNATDANQPLLSNNLPVFNHQNNSSNATMSNNHNAEYSKTSSPAPSSIPKVHNNGILITINEKFNAQFQRDGSIISSELKGDLQLRINDSELSKCKILLKTDNKSNAIQYKTHPNVDRNLFNQEHIIGLKDKAKSFPFNDQNLGVLRWRAVGKTEESQFLPILITIWSNVNDNNTTDVTVEYELTSEFLANNLTNTTVENVQLYLPVQDEVNLKDDNDNISYNIDNGIVFNINSISSDDPQGSFEFQISTVDEDSLFPMNLQFNINYTNITESDSCFGNVQVIDVVSSENENEESLPFDLHENLIAENYQIS